MQLWQKSLDKMSGVIAPLLADKFWERVLEVLSPPLTQAEIS